MTGLGRPTKLTRELQDEIVSWLSRGVNRAEVVAHVGIDYSTFYRWLRRGETEQDGGIHAEFRAAVLKAQARPRMIVQMAVVTAAGKGDVGAMRLFMSQKPSKEFMPPENQSDDIALEIRAQLYEFVRDPFTAALLEFHGCADDADHDGVKSQILELLKSRRAPVRSTGDADHRPEPGDHELERDP